MKISKLIIDFLEYLEVEKNASQLTIRNYDHYLQRFLAFVSDIDPKDINLDLVRKYRVFLARYVDEKTGLSLKRVTQNYFIIALRAFLRYLAKIDVETLAAEKIELGDQEARPIKVLDDEQLDRLLSAPEVSSIEDSKWQEDKILEVLRKFKDKEGVSMKEIYFIVTGREQGLPLIETMVRIDGREEILKKLQEKSS